MRWIGEPQIVDGVSSQRFELDVGSEVVTANAWLPAGASGPRPLLLLGHGGGGSATRSLTARSLPANHALLATRMVGIHGFAAAAIDQPGFGRRRADPNSPQAQWLQDFMAMAAKTPEQRRAVIEEPEESFRQQREANLRVADEWMACLDALQGLEQIGSGPVGFFGISLGASLGIPFLAKDSRITAAVIGLMGLHRGDLDHGWGPRWTEAICGDLIESALPNITAPLLFLHMWQDELVPRSAALELFDAIGSTDKTFYGSPGGHTSHDIPGDDELPVHIEGFLRRRLTSGV